MCIYKQPELISSMFVLWRDVRPVRLWHWWISWVGRFHIGIFSHCRVTWISIAFWELYLFIVHGSRASPFPRLSRPTGDVTSASRVPCSFRPWYDYDNIFHVLIAPETFLFLFLEKTWIYGPRECSESKTMCLKRSTLEHNPLKLLKWQECWAHKPSYMEHRRHLKHFVLGATEKPIAWGRK